jgi:hypothetical protein
VGYIPFLRTNFHRSQLHTSTSASIEQVELNEAHEPRENAVEAFNQVLTQIKSEVIKSRHDWDKHEPKMWSRASGLSNNDLTNFTIEKDLVLVRVIASSNSLLRSTHP